MGRLKEAEDYLLTCQARKIEPDPYGFLHGAKFGEDVISHLEAKRDTFKNPRTREKYSTCIMRITEARMNTAMVNVDEG